MGRPISTAVGSPPYCSWASTRALATTTSASATHNGGQSDFLLLLVLDKENKTITPIHINRDVMTEITILGVLGDEAGTINSEIARSHGFGDGKEQSCEYTCDAVRNLFLDIDIDYYVSMNLDGISELNDFMGGVTVTINEDMSALDPAMTAGTTLTLHGDQAEYFVRSRMNVGDGTNTARMERQRQYMAELGRMVYDRLQEGAGFIGELFDELEPMLVTDMARGTMINVAWLRATTRLASLARWKGRRPSARMNMWSSTPTKRL